MRLWEDLVIRVMEEPTLFGLEYIATLVNWPGPPDYSAKGDTPEEAEAKLRELLAQDRLFWHADDRVDNLRSRDIGEEE